MSFPWTGILPELFDGRAPGGSCDGIFPWSQHPGTPFSIRSMPNQSGGPTRNGMGLWELPSRPREWGRDFALTWENLPHQVRWNSLKIELFQQGQLPGSCFLLLLSTFYFHLLLSTYHTYPYLFCYSFWQNDPSFLLTSLLCTYSTYCCFFILFLYFFSKNK